MSLQVPRLETALEQNSFPLSRIRHFLAPFAVSIPALKKSTERLAWLDQGLQGHASCKARSARSAKSELSAFRRMLVDVFDHDANHLAVFSTEA